MLKKLKVYVSHPQYLAVGLCFLLLSTLFALWITRIPEVKQQLSISEGELGTALFFTPLGALISMLLSASLIKWKGEGRSTYLALIGYGLSIITPILAFDYFTLCVALFVVGFTMGWVDISMNAVANTLEKEHGVKIMNTSHGFFSLGGIVGGVVGGLLAGWQWPAIYQMIGALAVLIILVSFFIIPQIKSVRDISDNKDHLIFNWPGKSLLGLAIVAFCIMLGEGAIADWSTVFLSETINAGPALAGFGFAAFSATMTIGRFNGDYFIELWGNDKVLKTGLLLAFVGLLLLFNQTIIVALIGFALIGLGYSTVVPILFSSASRKEGVSPAKGLASVATLGYFGFLIGPVIIGWSAEVVGLTVSFGILLLLTTLAFVLVLKKVV